MTTFLSSLAINKRIGTLWVLVGLTAFLYFINIWKIITSLLDVAIRLGISIGMIYVTGKFIDHYEHFDISMLNDLIKNGFQTVKEKVKEESESPTNVSPDLSKALPCKIRFKVKE